MASLFPDLTPKSSDLWQMSLYVSFSFLQLLSPLSVRSQPKRDTKTGGFEVSSQATSQPRCLRSIGRG